MASGRRWTGPRTREAGGGGDGAQQPRDARSPLAAPTALARPVWDRGCARLGCRGPRGNRGPGVPGPPQPPRHATPGSPLRQGAADVRSISVPASTVARASLPTLRPEPTRDAAPTHSAGAGRRGGAPAPDLTCGLRSAAQTPRPSQPRRTQPRRPHHLAPPPRVAPPADGQGHSAPAASLAPRPPVMAPDTAPPSCPRRPPLRPPAGPPTPVTAAGRTGLKPRPAAMAASPPALSLPLRVRPSPLGSAPDASGASLPRLKATPRNRNPSPQRLRLLCLRCPASRPSLGLAPPPARPAQWQARTSLSRALPPWLRPRAPPLLWAPAIRVACARCPAELNEPRAPPRDTAPYLRSRDCEPPR